MPAIADASGWRAVITRRVVLVGTALSETSDSAVDELTEIVEAIRFEHR